ncbi:MAG: hypothetical protein CO186_12760 [Zetaproteobacteria bacterium CG_4_9_14_3_um_filter_49_83]|nr:MAG: hypothetical protein AUJ56_01530 [Zetaproteobacteria bacterium CG1_02_49_23]PIQ33981.1 MAG: hypothetical protein COW62_03565 [Zetaproteobacteria bacterium CG17_big_fil_post_rev_8_21_14_2_50_50_13]PIV30532.1 MAG: hypothetical protein COS35_06195 [Zetaproteobacteria bacterium CG02_land_8_20_14_3_00_50_9]PIY56496.1 MAG: hypothetical protein COZ00_03875 [Zetaproteobacteria bacterium CG_4_10_14_0_8_um_filter_49_80]PJA33799.1 MAG: hypothetical protein CO186_12760 [Zetaproteobacteria bacterium
MIYVKDQQDECDCYFQAHVRINHHPHQWGCFASKIEAEQWAYWLQKKIITRDLFDAAITRTDQS